MNDVLPAEIGAWQHFESCTRELLAAYGYEEIRVPLLEHTELFQRAIGESGARSRIEVATRAGLNPLVDREEEIALVSKCWERTKEGKGQVVMLSGEPSRVRCRWPMTSSRVRGRIRTASGAAARAALSSAASKRLSGWPPWTGNTPRQYPRGG